MNVSPSPAWGVLWSIALVTSTACGGDDDGFVDSDPGDGSGTLLVRASIENDGDGADIEVRVDRGGEDVNDAEVVISHDDGDEVLSLEGGGDYRGDHPGWSDSYRIEVTAGDDWLDGALEAPDLPELVDPTPTVAFDPHDAEDGVVRVTWDGAAGMSVRVKTKDFEWEGDDTGELEIPATSFEEEDQELEISRRNTIDLEGGSPGSELTVSARTKVTLIVVNPYEN